MTPRESILRARQLLTEVGTPAGKVGEKLQEIGSFLDAALAQLDASVPQATVTRAARRGLAPIEYLVEPTAQGEMLTEKRTSGSSQPFRCSRTLYDAMVATFKGADGPMSLEDVAAIVAKRLGDRPAEFQIRVPLRLWLHANPPLLNKIRTRYRPASATFQTDADALWKKLKKPGEQIG